MEPDMFVEMVNDNVKKGVPIAKVAGDDDHTGINQVHQGGNISIEKESDKNLMFTKMFQRNCTTYKNVTRVSHKKLYFL